MYRTAIALTLFSSFLIANPQDPTVSVGEVVFRDSGSLLQIETSDRAVIDWKDFSIGSGEETRFIQPSSSSVAINRVSGSLSELLGTLNANGKVYLINPNGVLVGKDCVVNTASFIASSLDLLEEGPNLCFNGDSKAPVVNLGVITASAGDAALIGYSVENNGSLSAPQGTAILGAGAEMLLQPSSKERVFIKIAGGAVANAGQITSLRAVLKAEGNPFAFAIGQSGKIDALSVLEQKGEVFLVSEEGAIELSGSITALGGEVRILGQENRVSGTIDAPSGTILVGGDYRGQGIPTSKRTFVSPTATLSTSAGEHGTGGKIILWGDEATANYGTLHACGGALSGDGGLIEISSKGYLAAEGFVDTRAPFGKTGSVLLDPCAVTIGMADAGISMFPPPGYSFSGMSATINAMTLITTYLAASDVIIDASATGTAPIGSGSITVNNGVAWGSGNKLTLIADDFIQFNNGVLSLAVVPVATEILSIQAPTVVIGDPTHSTSVNLNVGGSTGTVQVSAPNALFIYGGDGQPTTLAGDFVDISCGNLTLESGTIMSSDAVLRFFATGAQILFSGDISMNAQAAPASITSTTGPADLLIQGNGNITMNGGNGGDCSSVIALINGGTITSTIGGDYTLQGGTASSDGNCGIVIQNGSGSIALSGANYFLTGGPPGGAVQNNAFIIGRDGTIQITSTGSTGFFLQGGTGADHGASIISFVSGDLILNCASELRLMSGTASNANSQISCSGSFFATIGGDLTMTTLSSGGSSQISLNTAGSTLDLSIGGSLTMTADGDIANFSTPDNSVCNLTAHNWTLTAGNAACTFLQASGTTNVNLTGDMTLQGGYQPLSFSAIASAPAPGAVSTLTMRARDYYLNGGSAIVALALISLGDFTNPGIGGGGTLSLEAFGSNGFSLTAGTGDITPAAIALFGTAPHQSILINSPHPSSNIVLTGSSNPAAVTTSAIIITFVDGSIIDPIGGSIILNGTVNSPASISVGPGGGDLLLVAGKNIELQSAFSSISNTGPGNATLVVDNDFPTSPGFGPGFFLSASGSAVTTTGGALRIFTSQQNFNSIQGTLNGLAFVPGTPFVDTAQEQWGTYYPSTFGGVPFTIFYKTTFNAVIQQAMVIVDQLLADLHPYNEFPGWLEEFQIANSENDKVDHFYFRRRHINLINTPKSYTVWME